MDGGRTENSLERAVDSVATALDFAESRPRAWLLAAAGLVITIGCWWIGLTTDAMESISVGSGSRMRLALLIGLVGVVLAGPFVMIASLWQAVRGPDAEDTRTDGLLFTQGDRVGEQRRRRMILAAALLAIVNAVALFLARGN